MQTLYQHLGQLRFICPSDFTQISVSSLDASLPGRNRINDQENSENKHLLVLTISILPRCSCRRSLCWDNLQTSRPYPVDSVVLEHTQRCTGFGARMQIEHRQDWTLACHERVREECVLCDPSQSSFLFQNKLKIRDTLSTTRLNTYGHIYPWICSKSSSNMYNYKCIIVGTFVFVF